MQTHIEQILGAVSVQPERERNNQLREVTSDRLRERRGGSKCAGMHCCKTLSGHKEDSIVALMAIEG